MKNISVFLAFLLVILEICTGYVAAEVTIHTINTDGETIIPALAYIEKGLFNTELGSIKDNVGECAVLSYGDKLVYRVNVAKSGLYTLSIDASPKSAKTIQIYIDGTRITVGSAIPAVGTELEPTVRQYYTSLLLPEGVHDIEFRITGGSFYLKSLIFEQYAKQISATGTTFVPSKDYNTKAPNVVKENNYLVFNGWIEYVVNVTREGFYDISLQIGSGNFRKIYVYVNGELSCSGNITSTGSVTNIMDFPIGTVYLKAGKNTVKVENPSLGCYYNGFVLDSKPDLAAGFEVGADLEEGNTISIPFNAPYTGVYRMVLNASSFQKDACAYVSSNAQTVGSFNYKKTDSISAYADNLCFINLQAGANQVVITQINKDVKIRTSQVQFAFADESRLNNFVTAINSAKTHQDITDVFHNYEDVTGVILTNEASDVFYKTPIFMRLIGRKFVTVQEIIEALWRSVALEKENPMVTLEKNNQQLKELESGNLKLTIRTDMLKDPCTVVAAIYRNNILYMIRSEEFLGAQSMTMYLNNVAVEEGQGYSFKLLFIGNYSTVKPITIYNAVYKDIYVSENGDDLGGGTVLSPFKTIGRAKQEIANSSSSMNGDIVVHIMPGYYRLSQTETFTNAHSGKNGHNIIFRGEDYNNPPIIGGGKRVTGWQHIGGGVYKASLATNSAVRNMYINGMKAIRARGKETYKVTGVTLASGTQYDIAAIKIGALSQTFARENELELVWHLEWCNQRTLVDSITRGNDQVTFNMKAPYFNLKPNAIQNTTVSAGKSFYIENARELLDDPGEFYYDKVAQEIYYIPYAEEDMNTAEVYVPETEGLIQLKGDNLNNKVRNIVFDNLDFRYGAWNMVSNNGLTVVQADNLKAYDGTYIALPGQIKVEKADNISIINCKFSCLDSAAIRMHDAVSNSKIEGNVIKDISGSGIIVGSWEHEKKVYDSEICRNIGIQNNVIRRIGNEYASCTAISVYYENGISIKHNDIADLPYSGISIGWGWGSYNVKNSGNMNVSNNKTTNVMRVLKDGAHIYTVGPLYSSSIYGNHLVKSGDSDLGGVYTDSASAYLSVYDNVIEKCDKWFFTGVYSTHDMKIFRNYSDTHYYDKRGENNTYEDAILIQNGAYPQAAIGIIDNAGLSAGYTGLLNNTEIPSWRKHYVDTTPNRSYEKFDVYEINGSKTYIEAENFHNCYDPQDDRVLVARDAIAKYVSFNKSEWMEYNINVIQPGTYKLTAVAGSLNTPKKMAVLINGTEVCRGNINTTNDWSDYQEHIIGQFILPAGTSTLRLYKTEEVGGFHLNYFFLEKVN